MPATSAGALALVVSSLAAAAVAQRRRRLLVTSGSLTVAVAGPAATGPTLLDGMWVAFGVAALLLGLAAHHATRSTDSAASAA
jgi:hypothetical protein